MTIAFMRHGQTDWNLAGRVQGHTNIPLNETGREQARQAASAPLVAQTEWGHITSSPLDRARETAEIVAQAMGVSLGDALDLLIEQNYGEAEGCSVTELEERWPTREFERGESPAEVAKRALDALHLLEEHHGDSPVLAVTHGAYIRRLIATVHDLEYGDVPGILNASLTMFERDAKGNWQATLINDQPASQALDLSPQKPAAPFAGFVALGDQGAGVCSTDGVCTV